ncbi:hypothetical protein C8Q75DRAFT_804158 [Abortiporus biennis]|nr:hypothetical protein C8Q75DRAFT_804158 [Abortiporus biennis]
MQKSFSIFAVITFLAIGITATPTPLLAGEIEGLRQDEEDGIHLRRDINAELWGIKHGPNGDYINFKRDSSEGQGVDGQDEFNEIDDIPWKRDVEYDFCGVEIGYNCHIRQEK